MAGGEQTRTKTLENRRRQTPRGRPRKEAEKRKEEKNTTQLKNQ
jgi:hypothetical protein